MSKQANGQPPVVQELLDFRQAVIDDLGIHRFGRYRDSLEALRAIARELFTLSPNEIRGQYSMDPHPKTEDAGAAAIAALMADRPITPASVLRCIFAMPAADKSRLTAAIQRINAHNTEGMMRFMHLSRVSMKYGKTRLLPDALVSEIQSNFVTRQEVAKFNDKNFYRTREWKELRLAVLSAARVCCLCGAGPDRGPLHVDHIKPRSLWPELSLAPENMQVLCGPCNVAKSNVVEMRY